MFSELITKRVRTDAEIRPVVEALRKQVSNDFRPAWGVDAKLNFVGNAPPPDGTWWLAILDDSDQAGALGYHDLTPDGLPIGKVFRQDRPEIWLHLVAYS